MAPPAPDDPPRQPTAAYLAMTPYHVFLSSGMALSHSGTTQNHLLLLEDFVDAQRLSTAVRDWRDSPFASIQTYPGSLTNPLRLARAASIARNAARVCTDLARIEPNRLFVFNDARAEGQSAVRWAKLERTGVATVCVEDGTAMYSSLKVPYRSGPLARLARRAVYGRSWLDIGVIGTSPWVDEIHLLVPELARWELQKKPMVRLDPALMRAASLRTLAEGYCEAFSEVARVLPLIEAVLVLSHTDAIVRPSSYRETIRETATIAAKKGIRLAIKYHPRERLPDPLNLGEPPSFVVIPRGLSTEFLLAAKGSRLKYVIGDTSTALITARCIVPDVVVSSIAPIVGEGAALYPVFAQLGVRLISDRQDLARVFDECA